MGERDHRRGGRRAVREVAAVDALALLLAVTLLAVPGFGITLAFAPPDALPLLSRIALALPFGFAVVGLVSLVLALAGQHHAATVAPILAVVTAGAWVVGLRRDPLRDYLAAWREQVRRLRGTYVVLLVLVIGFAIVRSTYGPEGQIAPTALRYWADGLEIADAHEIPEQALHWLGRFLGISYPPAVLLSITIGVFLLVLYRISMIVSKLKDNNIALAQKVAILEYQIEALRESREEAPHS